LKKDDVLSVVKLLTSLGLHTLVRALEQRGGAVPVRHEEGLRDRMASMEMFSGVGKQDELSVENTMQSKTVVKRRRRTKTCKKEVSNIKEAQKPVKKVFPGRYCVMWEEGKKYLQVEGTLHK
jgi:hypothetical protein